MYTTYPAPAGIAASIKALELIRGELMPEQSAWLEPSCGDSTFTRAQSSYDSPIIPFVVGDNASAMELGQRLSEAGVRVGVIRPPSVPARTSRLRISINRNLSGKNFNRRVTDYQ